MIGERCKAKYCIDNVVENLVAFGHRAVAVYPFFRCLPVPNSGYKVGGRDSYPFRRGSRCRHCRDNQRSS